MKIMIVSESASQATYWEKLIALVVPEADLTITTEFFSIQVHQEPIDLIFLVSEDGKGDFYKWVQYAAANGLPLICSVQQINEQVIEVLKKFGIKGYVNLHCSLDELETAIELVSQRKGTFLKFVN